MSRPLTFFMSVGCSGFSTGRVSAGGTQLAVSPGAQSFTSIGGTIRSKPCPFFIQWLLLSFE